MIKQRDPIMVIVLSIVTCGIYQYYWWYQAMVQSNNVARQERINPVTFIVLSILCPPVIWYVMYKVDETLVVEANNRGIPYTSNFILWLLLTFVVSVGVWVAIYQIQTAFNNIAAANNGQAGR